MALPEGPCTSMVYIPLPYRVLDFCLSVSTTDILGPFGPRMARSKSNSVASCGRVGM